MRFLLDLIQSRAERVREATMASAPFRDRWTTTADDPQWKTYFHSSCESPAEIAFVDAVVDGFDLIPHRGKLVSGKLTLDLQVVKGSYRLDFVADDWLIVEIDGAAYHSSAEAVARDWARDEHFKALGYAVLRIPAKTVFSTPELAVHLLRSALATGRPERPVPIEKQPEVAISIQDVLTAPFRAISYLNDFVSAAQERERQNALKAMEAEKARLAQAITIQAEADRRVEQFRAQSEDHRRMFDANFDELSSLFGERPLR